MNEQFEKTEPEAYSAPMLAEVGGFTEDTLGGFGGRMDWFLIIEV